MIEKISHITILVKNQNEALEFYQGKLGFKIHTDVNFGEMRWLTLNASDQLDVELLLMLAGPGEEDLVGRQAGTQPILALKTDDCHKTFNKLKSLGVQFDSDPKDEEWGIGVTFRDLYGNRIYLNQEKL
jgi:catechol 2,3-dioxygenase-like lactoylglutathione lyase family enzyme